MITEERYGRHRLEDFSLDPSRVHLNHGSYGAVPRALLEAQARWRAEVERNPSDFFRRALPLLLRQRAVRVAEDFGGRAEDWVFVENATQGACSAVRALHLAPGDHVAATSEIYNAVRMALRYMGGPAVEVEEIEVPIPLGDDAEAVAAIERSLRPTTKAIFVDHMTSRSALRMPVGRDRRPGPCPRRGALHRWAHTHPACWISTSRPSAPTGTSAMPTSGSIAPRGCAFFWTKARAPGRDPSHGDLARLRPGLHRRVRLDRHPRSLLLALRGPMPWTGTRTKAVPRSGREATGWPAPWVSAWPKALGSEIAAPAAFAGLDGRRTPAGAGPG